MKLLVLALFVFASGCVSVPLSVQKALTPARKVPQTVAFSRYLMISTCYSDEKFCREPVVKDLETANTSAPFVDEVATSTVSVVEEGLIFTGEVKVTFRPNNYLVELKLHSGNSEKRSSETAVYTFLDVDLFKENVLMDKPIVFKKGILRAQLVFGPVLNITK